MSDKKIKREAMIHEAQSKKDLATQYEEYKPTTIGERWCFDKGCEQTKEKILSEFKRIYFDDAKIIRAAELVIGGIK